MGWPSKDHRDYAPPPRAEGDLPEVTWWNGGAPARVATPVYLVAAAVGLTIDALWVGGLLAVVWLPVGAMICLELWWWRTGRPPELAPVHRWWVRRRRSAR